MELSEALEQYTPKFKPVSEEQVTIQNIINEVSKTVVMPESKLHAAVGTIALQQHVLLEGQPGTGKTLLAVTLARAIGGTYGRAQGVPDAMPADITGASWYNAKTQEFEFRPGPIFNNIMLDDEINRMSTKAQAGTFEALQEKQVSVFGIKEPLKLPVPFSMIATQNQYANGQGVNPLPEAQIDRFLSRIEMVTTAADELIISQRRDRDYETQVVTSLEEVAALRAAIRKIAVSDEKKIDIVNLANAPYGHPAVDKKASQLSGMRKIDGIESLAQYSALVSGRLAIRDADIKFAAKYVLPHRVRLNYEALDKDITEQMVVDEIIAGHSFITAKD